MERQLANTRELHASTHELGIEGSRAGAYPQMRARACAYIYMYAGGHEYFSIFPGRGYSLIQQCISARPRLSVERAPPCPNRCNGNPGQGCSAAPATTRWRQDQPKPRRAIGHHDRLVTACQKLARLQFVSWISLAGLQSKRTTSSVVGSQDSQYTRTAHCVNVRR